MTTKKAMTHTGSVSWNSKMTRVIDLRETKLYWVDEFDTKFSKRHGQQTGVQGRGWLLDLASVKPIDHN